MRQYNYPVFILHTIRPAQSSTCCALVRFILICINSYLIYQLPVCGIA